MVNYVLREYLDIFVICYLDDILIYSNSEAKHEEHVHKVLQALQNANLLINAKKSEFYKQEITYLRCIITPGHIKMDPKKIAAVKEWQTPTTVTEVQVFFGFANYYRRFVKNFSKIAAPLSNL